MSGAPLRAGVVGCGNISDAYLTRAALSLETLRNAIQAGVRAFERQNGELDSVSLAVAQQSITLLKVNASELALETIMSAMRACGLSGYRTDNEFAMGRYLRDILSAPIMINNDRVLASAQSMVIVGASPPALM